MWGSGKVRVVGGCVGSTEGGVEKCAGVWGDVGKCWGR